MVAPLEVASTPGNAADIAQGGEGRHIAAMLADHILFIDAEAMVVDKPAGLPVTAVRDGALSLENHVDLLRFGFERRPTAVHRLDRDTSGCLLLARTPRAHKRFAAAFEAGEVGKRYLAVLDGVPGEAAGTIALALAKVSTREAGWRMVPDAKRGKHAVTHWRTLGEAGGKALVEFRPETGRTHQLRVHAASGLGIPILGDPVYGRGRATLLHARALSLPRERRGAVSAVAPVPAAFAALGFGEKIVTDAEA